MKHYGRMSKAELIRRLQALEAGSTPAEGAGEHARLVEELQTHQVELETQNWELREAQHLVEISRDRYADLYDFAPVGYVTLDDKGVIRELNLTAAGMLGSERARLLRVPFHLHVVREDLKPFREYLAQMVTNGQRAVTEVRLARKHAQPLPVLLQSVRQVDEESGRFWCRTSLTDLTERKQAEAALRASAALNHGILSSLSEHLAVLDPAGNILALNEAWIRYARANPDSACWQIQVGDNYLSLCESGLPLPPEAQLAAAGIKAVLQRTQPSFTLEYPCHTAAADHWFLLLVTPLATA